MCCADLVEDSRRFNQSSFLGSGHALGYDGHGNVTTLVNAQSGANSAKYEYSPFGELIRESEPVCKLNSFRFSTKFSDQETGLIYYGYRFYNPSQGRWIGRDVAEESGALNLFLFLANCPLTHHDTFGNMDYSEFSNIEGTIRSTFNAIGLYPSASLLGNASGALYMIKMFGTGGQFDFGYGPRSGETFDIGQGQKLTSDEATDYLVEYATGYASFATCSPLYLGGTGAASTAYDIIDFTANVRSGGLAQGYAGLATSIVMEYDGFVAGASDYFDQ